MLSLRHHPKIIFGTQLSGPLIVWSIHHQNSSSLIPFHANTGIFFDAIAAAAWSCVEKILHELHLTDAPSNVRVSILGHIQRGGIPSPSDRILASLLGYESINQITSGISNQMIGINDQKPVLVELKKAVSKKKKINLDLNKISDIISRY